MILSCLVCAFLFVKAYFRKMNLKSVGSNKGLSKLLKGNKDSCDHTFNTCMQKLSAQSVSVPSNKHDEKMKFLLDTQLGNKLSTIPF